MASVACGTYKDEQEAANKMVRIKETEYPEPELVKAYEARYQIWHELYPALKPMFKKMGELQWKSILCQIQSL